MADTLPTLQREVQRKLGRCMLCLQQYEQSMKALMANMAVEGPPEELQAIREQQVACIRSKTLGTLIGMFTGSYLSVYASPGQAAPEDTEADDKLPNPTWVRINFNMAVSSERHAQTKQALAELVDMRNDLVHHFLEHFDLWQESGCRAANAHLDACFEQINGHRMELLDWAKSMKNAWTLAATAMQSQQFIDAFVHGINLDGTVHWPNSTIVDCLRNAEQVCAIDGWALLDSAIAFIRLDHPDQAPAKYGCKNWRQVLKKSEQFEIRTDINALNAKGQTWYRSREEAAVNHKQAS